MKLVIPFALAALLGGLPQPTRAADSESKIAYAGWAVSGLDPAAHEQTPTLGGAGLTVEDLDPDGPAAQAGLLQKDILVQLDDQRLFTSGQLRALMRTLSPGGAHQLRVFREGGFVELDLPLGEREPPTQSAPGLRTVWVPFELWNSTTNWTDGLDDLVQREPPALDGGAEDRLRRWVARLLANGSEAWDAGIETVVLLQREPAESATLTGPAGLSLPERPVAADTGLGSSDMTDEQGSVEVKQRGGRDYVTVRDAQGAVLYEGPLESDQDLLLLRPLRPALRQAVERSVGPGRTVAPSTEAEVWQVAMPPRLF